MSDIARIKEVALRKFGPRKEGFQIYRISKLEGNCVVAYGGYTTDGVITGDTERVTITHDDLHPSRSELLHEIRRQVLMNCTLNALAIIDELIEGDRSRSTEPIQREMQALAGRIVRHGSGVGMIHISRKINNLASMLGAQYFRNVCSELELLIHDKRIDEEGRAQIRGWITQLKGL